MKLAAVIVLYHPDINDLKDNINSIINDVDALILFQNSLLGSDILTELAQSEKVKVLGDGENVGIATAMNISARWAIDHKYTHLLTLDQDSHFEKDHLAHYKRLVESHHDKAGVFGINPSNIHKQLYESRDGYIEVPDTITSGSIFPLSIFNDVGFFDDELFIDAVDYEFCYRAKQKKDLNTIVFPSVKLWHKVGYVTKTKLGFHTNNYSAFRTYFIVRNQIRMWIEYPKLFSNAYKRTLLTHHIFYRIAKVILGEEQKAKKIKAIFIGVIHAFKGRKGFYQVK